MSGCGCLSVGFADFWALRAENAGMGHYSRKCAQLMRAAPGQNIEAQRNYARRLTVSRERVFLFFPLRAPVNKGHLASPARVRIRVPRIFPFFCLLLDSSKFSSRLCSLRALTRTPTMVSVQEPRTTITENCGCWQLRACAKKRV